VNETLTVKEASAIYFNHAVSYWRLLEMVKAGEIPHCRVGRRILFRRSVLDQWMAERESKSRKDVTNS